MSKAPCDIVVVETTDIPKSVVNLILKGFTTQCVSGVPRVSYFYGKDQLKRSDYILMAKRDEGSTVRTLRSGNKKQLNETLCGFLFLQIYIDDEKTKYGYIDIVCSTSGYGYKLILEAEKLCKRLGCQYMRLSALDYQNHTRTSRRTGKSPFNLHSYYEDMGYEHVDKPCKTIKERPTKRDAHSRRRGEPGFAPNDGFRMTKCIDDTRIRQQMNAKRKRNNNINALIQKAMRVPLPNNSNSNNSQNSQNSIKIY